MRTSIIYNFVAAVCVVVILAEITHARSPPCVCNCPCTREFNPVCATNGAKSKQFPNRCVWQNYNCKNPSGRNAYPEYTQGPCTGKGVIY